VNSLARDDTPIAETTVAEPNEKLEKRPSFFQRTFSFRGECITIVIQIYSLRCHVTKTEHNQRVVSL
jgi:hypothetical protein